MKKYYQILIIFIACCVIIGAFLWLKKGKQNPPKNNIAGITDSKIINKNPVIQNVLNKVQEIFVQQTLADAGIQQDNQSYVVWKNSEGWTITSSSSPAVYSYYLCKDNNSRFKEVFPSVYQALEQSLVENGFAKNERNSAREYNEEEVNLMGYTYDKSYEQGNIQCVIQGLADCSGVPGETGSRYASSIGVVCTDNLKKNEEEQLPLLKALNLKDNAIYNVHHFGEFLVIGISQEELVVKANKNGTYSILYRGQEAPSCEIEAKYSFPDDVNKYFGLPCHSDKP